MSASELEVRQWARSQGIEVNVKGSVRSHVVDAYERAHARPATVAVDALELAARDANPAVFAAADDLLEAELARRGEFTPPPPRRVEGAPSMTLAEWLGVRERIAEVIRSSIPQVKASALRSAAEALLLDGWIRGAA